MLSVEGKEAEVQKVRLDPVKRVTTHSRLRGGYAKSFPGKLRSAEKVSDVRIVRGVDGLRVKVCAR